MIRVDEGKVSVIFISLYVCRVLRWYPQTTRALLRKLKTTLFFVPPPSVSPYKSVHDQIEYLEVIIAPFIGHIIELSEMSYHQSTEIKSYESLDYKRHFSLFLRHVSLKPGMHFYV